MRIQEGNIIFLIRFPNTDVKQYTMVIILMHTLLTTITVPHTQIFRDVALLAELALN